MTCKSRKSENFVLVMVFCHTLIGFAPSLSANMPHHFLGPSKTAGKM